MQTQRVELIESAWVDIAQGTTVLLVEGGMAGAFFLHFTNTATVPELDVPVHRVQTFQAPLDFTQYGLTAGQRVWARVERGSGYLVVTRAVDVFVRFIPSGSDTLLTANGLTYNSKEAA